MKFESIVDSVQRIQLSRIRGQYSCMCLLAFGQANTAGWRRWGAIRPRTRGAKSTPGLLEFDLLGYPPIARAPLELQPAVQSDIVAGIIFPYEDWMSRVSVCSRNDCVTHNSPDGKSLFESSSETEKILAGETLRLLLGEEDPFPSRNTPMGGEDPFPWGTLEESDFAPSSLPL